MASSSSLLRYREWLRERGEERRGEERRGDELMSISPPPPPLSSPSLHLQSLRASSSLLSFIFLSTTSQEEKERKASILPPPPPSSPGCFSCSCPTTNGGVQKWKLSRKHVRVAYTGFARFGARLACSVGDHRRKISASELRREAC